MTVYIDYIYIHLKSNSLSAFSAVVLGGAGVGIFGTSRSASMYYY